MALSNSGSSCPNWVSSTFSAAGLVFTSILRWLNRGCFFHLFRVLFPVGVESTLLEESSSLSKHLFLFRFYLELFSVS